MNIIKIVQLSHFDKNFPLPQLETPGSAGADLRVSFEDKGQYEVTPGEKILLPTGLKMEIPQGYEVQIRPRSGMSLNTPMMVVNAPGTIDADYRGEIKIIMGNMGNESYVIKHGDRVAQMVFSKVFSYTFEVVQEISDTDRSVGGFGSTGK